MELQNGYEIIRFIDQGSFTRIKMDYMKGTLLLEWLKDHKIIEKQYLYQWIEMLVIQICMFHKSHKSQCYRYLSPESVLVTEDGKLYLLDLEAESNAFIMRDMQRREMRLHFVKPMVGMHQNQRLEGDFYSLGKTIQFLLACLKPDSSFTKKEEKQINQFIQKCLGTNSRRSYQNIDQIQKEIPKYKRSKKYIRWLIVMAAVIGVVGIAGYCIPNILNSKDEKKMQSEVQESEKNEVELKQAEKSNVIEKKDEENEQSEIDVLQKYLQNHTTADNRRIMEEGETIEKEIVSCLGTAFDREEEYEKAMFYYQILTKLEENPNQLGITYLRMTEIEEKNERIEDARGTYQEAVEKCPENPQIAIAFVRFICKYDSLDKELQSGELQGLITAYPNLKEMEEFKKLQQEYGIKIEEEKVWVEKEEKE